MLPRLALICIATLAAASAKADDKDVVANAFHTDAQYLVMNLPPRPETWPGAIFTANLRVPIKHGDPKDPALHRGPPIGIGSNKGFNLGGGAKGGWSGFLGFSADAGDAADIVLSFPDARIIDMDQGDLIKHVEAAAEAIDAAKRGQIPLIVVKAYYGIPIVTITRKDTASADAWAKVKANAEVGINASSSSHDTVSYKGDEDIIFAFETAQIQFDPTDLDHSKMTIKLASMPSQLYAIREAYSEQATTQIIAASTGISIAEIQMKLQEIEDRFRAINDRMDAREASLTKQVANLEDTVDAITHPAPMSGFAAAETEEGKKYALEATIAHVKKALAFGKESSPDDLYDEINAAITSAKVLEDNPHVLASIKHLNNALATEHRDEVTKSLESALTHLESAK
jgi:hypothetical protein